MGMFESPIMASVAAFSVFAEDFSFLWMTVVRLACERCLSCSGVDPEKIGRLVKIDLDVFNEDKRARWTQGEGERARKNS